jgi:hypothetical protein
MRSLVATSLLTLSCGAGAIPAKAGETAKSTGRAIVKDLKDAGRAIRDSKPVQEVKKTGQEVGHAAAEGGREVARISTAAARDVRRVTVQYWDRALAAKRRRVAELEKENRELKKHSRER